MGMPKLAMCLVVVVAVFHCGVAVDVEMAAPPAHTTHIRSSTTSLGSFEEETEYTVCKDFVVTTVNKAEYCTNCCRQALPKVSVTVRGGTRVMWAQLQAKPKCLKLKCPKDTEYQVLEAKVEAAEETLEKQAVVVKDKIVAKLAPEKNDALNALFATGEPWVIPGGVDVEVITCDGLNIHAVDAEQTAAVTMKPGMCSEKATTSVVADYGACAGQQTRDECTGLMTVAEPHVPACKYSKAEGTTASLRDLFNAKTSGDDSVTVVLSAEAKEDACGHLTAKNLVELKIFPFSPVVGGTKTNLGCYIEMVSKSACASGGGTLKWVNAFCRAIDPGISIFLLDDAHIPHPTGDCEKEINLRFAYAALKGRAGNGDSWYEKLGYRWSGTMYHGEKRHEGFPLLPYNCDDSGNCGDDSGVQTVFKDWETVRKALFDAPFCNVVSAMLCGDPKFGSTKLEALDSALRGVRGVELCQSLETVVVESFLETIHKYTGETALVLALNDALDKLAFWGKTETMFNGAKVKLTLDETACEAHYLETLKTGHYFMSPEFKLMVAGINAYGSSYGYRGDYCLGTNCPKVDANAEGTMASLEEERGGAMGETAARVSSDAQQDMAAKLMQEAKVLELMQAAKDLEEDLH